MWATFKKSIFVRDWWSEDSNKDVIKPFDVMPEMAGALRLLQDSFRSLHRVFLFLLDRWTPIRRPGEFLLLREGYCHCDRLFRFCHRLLNLPEMQYTLQRWQTVGSDVGPALMGHAGKKHSVCSGWTSRDENCHGRAILMWLMLLHTEWRGLLWQCRRMDNFSCRVLTYIWRLLVCV
jgi:hypothetical protein